MRRFKPARLAARVRRPRALVMVAPGLAPAGRLLGLDRGVPIDRYWIDCFLRDHRHRIRGRCLEVGGDRYVRTFGTGVTSVDVLDLDPNNDRATIHGDLRALTHVQDGSYDCLVLTQVLQYVDDLQAAVAECARILVPGGALLVSVPTTQPIDPFAPEGLEAWRFTTRALEWLAGPHFGEADLEIRAWGNSAAGAACFLGMAQEDLRRSLLDDHDPAFPCLATMCAVKPRQNPAP